MTMAERQDDRLAAHAADSFRNAMIEPVKVSAPMATPSDISNQTPIYGYCRGCRCRRRSAHRTPPPPTRTAAIPTSEWKAATSSGIEVIGTCRAITAPMASHPQHQPEITRIQEPMPCGGMAGQRRDDRDRHADDAEHVPAAASMVPGVREPRSAMMNRTPATRVQKG